MRELEFRVSHYTLEGFKAFTYFRVDKDSFLDEQGRGSYKNTVIKTIEQYTGLRDKNGTKIFEGDILRHTVINNPNRVGEVFENVVNYYNGNVCGWRLQNKSFTMKLTENWIFNQEPEVVGNIHEQNN